MLISSVTDYKSSCHLHRTTLPFRYLSKDSLQHQWKLSNVDPSEDFDCWWAYGCLFMSNLPKMVGWKRTGKKLIFGMDDDVWHFPKWRTDSVPEDARATAEVLIEISDLLIASTPALALEIGHPEKTVVAPNLVVPSAYGRPTPPTDDGPIRILWSGSATHKGDLDLIDDACCELLNKYGNQIQFIFVGAGPDRLLRDHWNDRVQLIDWVPLADYWSTIHNINPHIVLSPLVDCPFNRAKSNIRILESWSINAAVVASKVGEYRVVESEVNGLYANSTDEWVEQISRLIESRELRESLAANGWKTVNEDWSWVSKSARSKWSSVIDWLDEQSEHN